ncbi:MAG: hypothetical protein JWN10_2086, partial [Solirubrobacterales bacterium]|nr:hypothetical protein [Solirubrobacterales bacterium]
MTLRDLRVGINLVLAVAVIREYGRSEYWRGKRDAWLEANELIADHRTRYDPKPVSARER